MVQCNLCLLGLFLFVCISLFVQTKEITNKTTFTRIWPLEAFSTYCVYLMVQFVNKQGVRSAHSQVLGPRCADTPSGGMFLNHKDFCFVVPILSSMLEA